VRDRTGVASVSAAPRFHRLLCALFALLPLCAAARAPLAIVDVSIVDVVHARASPPRTVLIADGRIVSTRATAHEIPHDAVRVDGRGKFLIPGLIDLHVHLFNNASHRPANEWTFPLFVANGVTGVREMLTTPDELTQIQAWRDAVQRGDTIAPRVLAAGVFPWADSDEKARAIVRESAHGGADFIKVFSELTPTRWHAILDEATAQHLPVDGHVPATVALLDAAHAGQRTAEHLMQVYEACSSIEPKVLAARRDLDGDAATALRDAQEREILQAFDPRACQNAARAIAASGQAQVATIVLEYFDPARPHGDIAADPRWPLLRADEQARWQRIVQENTPGDRALADLRWDVTCRIVRTLHAAGARVLAGTDTPMPLIYPGYSLHDELERLTECGLTPAQALRAATVDAADLLGKANDFGTVEAGKRADLVLLDADPLRGARSLRRIRAVVLAGRLLPRADLDKLIAH